MRAWQNHSHVRWYCRYHIVLVPQYRQKAIFGTLRKDIGKMLRERCKHMGIELVAGHAMPDHGHLCLSISQVEGGACCGALERESRHPHSSRISWADPQLHGAALLGQRIRCEYRRLR